MRPLFEPESSSARDNTCASPISTPAPFLLDFLYTKRTRSYLRRISAAAASNVNDFTRRNQSTEAIPHTKAPSDTRTLHQPLVHVAGLGEPTRNSTTSVASKEESLDLKELKGYIEAHKRGEQQNICVRAWQLYTGLALSERRESVKRGMINLLATSRRPLDAGRIVRLASELAVKDMSIMNSLHIIQAHILLKEPGKAYSWGLEAIGNHPSVYTFEIFSTLLQYFIRGGYWQLAFGLWERRAARLTTQQLRDSRDDTDQIYSCAKSITDLPYRVRNLRRKMKQYPELAATPVQERLVVRLIEAVYRSGKWLGYQDDLQALSELQHAGRLTPKIVESAILNTLGSSTSSADQVRKAFALYQNVGPRSGLKPTRTVLRTLLGRAVRVDNSEVVRTLYTDWSEYTPLLRDTALFMKFFAHHGDVDLVDAAFKQYMDKYYESTKSRRLNNISNADGSADDVIRLFYPLLHVRALRADAEGVKEQLSRLTTEFADLQIQPDIECYNILMHAYQRNDDLDGCLDCMSEIFEKKLRPDHYTFGTLMSVAADRGDSDLIEELDSTARDLHIAPSQVMHDCHVLALLNNERPQAAEKYANKALNTYGLAKQTFLWNQILSYYALNSALPANRRKSLALARTMQKNGIPYDSSTFAAIIRAYADGGKTSTGLRIINNTMLPSQIPVTAFHYALIIDGFTKERFFAAALRVHAGMLHKGIKPDFSVRLALLKLHTMSAMNKLTYHGTTRDALSTSDHERLRLDLTEELLQEIVRPDEKLLTSKTPRLKSTAFSLTEAQPGAAFDSIMTTYSSVQAYDIVKMLLDRYTASRSSDKPFPLRIILSAMRLSHKQRDASVVLRYWDLAVTSASRLTSPVVINPDTTHPPKRTPTNSTILSRHLDLALRSLAGSNQLDRIPSLISSHYAAGYTLDNRNWNLYVRLLATHNHHTTAFSLAETHLTPSFRGWRPDPKARRISAAGLRSEGLEYQAPRHTFLQHGEYRIQYATVVRLAHSVRKLRERAPFETEAGRVLVALKREAPKTWSAVADLPLGSVARGEHPAATHVLGGVARRGDRRRIG